MSIKAGVWIDHRQALIVKVTAAGEESTRILSNVEKHAERGGDSPMKGHYEAQQVPADDSRQRALTGNLNTYYDQVIAALHDCETVLLIGPGEAKGELHQRLEKKNLGARVAAVEPADKLTDSQVVARAREYFGLGAPRTASP
jgi:hypothetical protein